MYSSIEGSVLGGWGSQGGKWSLFRFCPGASDEASSSSFEVVGRGRGVLWGLMELAQFPPGRGKLGKPTMPSWPEVGCRRPRCPSIGSSGAAPSGRREDWVPRGPPNMRAHSHLSTLAPATPSAWNAPPPCKAARFPLPLPGGFWFCLPGETCPIPPSPTLPNPSPSAYILSRGHYRDFTSLSRVFFIFPTLL